MRVLLDEGVAHQLAAALSACGISTSIFPNGWKGLRNGRLLSRTQTEGLTVLLTNDRSLNHQQNLTHRLLAIVALPTSRPRIVVPRARDIAQTIEMAGPGDCITIDFNGSRRLMRRGSTSSLPPIEPFSL